MNMGGDAAERLVRDSLMICPHTRFAGQKNNLYNGKG